MTQARPRIVVHGAAGRMGRAVIGCILESDRATLACALVRQASGLTGEAFAESLAPGIVADVLIDFSSVGAFDAALALALERRLGFVSGTTGLSAEQFVALGRAARSIPVLWASNFSLGIAMLAGLARRTAQSLPDWDCELVEMHHSRKQDAPSGTALTLGQAVAQGRRIALDEHARFERHGQIGARPPGEIGFATLRGGDVVGEHTLIFASAGERIELIHRATNRDIFARGALAAAIWLAGRAPGRYSFDEVLVEG